jgi:hypothetical protein
MYLQPAPFLFHVKYLKERAALAVILHACITHPKVPCDGNRIVGSYVFAFVVLYIRSQDGWDTTVTSWDRRWREIRSVETKRNVNS